jgi:hypothetical protein
MFGRVEDGCDADGVPVMRVRSFVTSSPGDRTNVPHQVMGIVDVKQTGEHELMLEWESSASNDMVADSTLALITGIDKSPASAKREHIPSSLCPLQRPPSCSKFTLERFVGRGCWKMARYPNADDKRSSQSCFLISLQ